MGTKQDHDYSVIGRDGKHRYFKSGETDEAQAKIIQTLLERGWAKLDDRANTTWHRSPKLCLWTESGKQAFPRWISTRPNGYAVQLTEANEKDYCCQCYRDLYRKRNGQKRGNHRLCLDCDAAGYILQDDGTTIF